MAGKGKTGRLATKSAAKRTARRSGHREFKDGHITNGSIRRLARRGGVKRLSFQIHSHVRDYVDDFLNRVVRDSLSYAEHRKARTITALDVVYALKKNGRVLYGYGG